MISVLLFASVCLNIILALVAGFEMGKNRSEKVVFPPKEKLTTKEPKT
jgi:hypothetical protein